MILALTRVERLEPNPAVCRVGSKACADKSVLTLIYPDGREVQVNVVHADSTAQQIRQLVAEHALAWGESLRNATPTEQPVPASHGLRAAVAKQISLLTNPSVPSTGEGVAAALQAALDAEPAAAEPVAKPAVAGLREAVQLEIKRIGPSIYLRDTKSRLQAALDAEPERCPEAERLAEAIERYLAGKLNFQEIEAAHGAYRARYPKVETKS